MKERERERNMVELQIELYTIERNHICVTVGIKVIFKVNFNKLHGIYSLRFA